MACRTVGGVLRKSNEVADEAALRPSPALFAQIQTGTKCAPVAGEDDTANIAILVCLDEQPRQIIQHRPGNRAHALGRVERDDSDMIGYVIEDFVGLGLHGALGMVHMSSRSV